MKLQLLTVEHLLELHVLVIEKFGGSAGVRDMGRLDAALATQTQEVFGEELYPTVLLKAAAITRGILADHAFVDGNKRTAMLVGLTFIETNGYKFVGHKSSIEDFAVQIAVEHLSVEDIAEWLEKNSKTKGN